MTAPLICYILIGLPGSGKSTLATKIRNQSPHYQIISTDQIRANLLGDATNQNSWPTIEAEVLSQIQQALTAGNPIIYDATNYRRHYRIDLLQKLAHHQNIDWVALYLKTPIEQCKAWNQQRSRQVPETIIDTMAIALKTFPPMRAEGFTSVNEIVNLSTDFPIKTV